MSDCDQAVARIGELCGPEYGARWRAELARYRRAHTELITPPQRRGRPRVVVNALELARGLRRVRLEQGMSVTDLAEIVTATRSTVSRMEAGQPASPEMWSRLASALGVTVAELVTRGGAS